MAAGSNGSLRFPPLAAQQDHGDDWRVLLFLHIPKTAGSNLRYVIASQYGRGTVYSPDPTTAPSDDPYWRWIEEGESFPGQRHVGWDPNEHVRRALAAVPDEQLWSLRAVMGHMWYGIHDALPRPSSYFTVLRDPVERVLSLYYHRRDQDGLRLSLEEYVSAGRDFEIDNGQTRYLCGRLDDADVRFTPCTDAMLQAAQRHLEERFSVVGIAERFAESLHLMARTFAWNVPFYDIYNENRRRPRGRQVPNAIRERIAEHNRFDVELYEFAERIFERQLALARPPIDSRTVRGFRRSNLLRRHRALQAVYPVARPVLRSVRAGARRTKAMLARTAMSAPAAGQPAASAGGEGRGIVERLEFVRTKIAPLPVEARADVPRRVNFLVAEIGPEYFFGGRIAELNLAVRLARQGEKVRVVLVDPSPDPSREHLRRFQGLEDLLDRVEVVPAARRMAPIPVSPTDSFVATNWWTAHIAAAACRSVGLDRFLYVIQEYDFLAVPRGPYAALADEAYTFPHFALFSTELLQAFFRHRRLGVYRQGSGSGDASSAVFRNAITPVGEIGSGDLASRTVRRFLMYARPEVHAERNLFEIAMHGLSRAVRRDAFRGPWEFIGIGKQGSPLSLTWGPVRIRLLPRTDQVEYARLLRASDLGLALQYSPHPGLVSIEMASAGMPVVTNTYETKTAEALRAISPNIVPVDPSIEAVARGLEEAALRVDDYEARGAGAHVDWPTDWDDSFGTEVLEAVRRFVSPPV